MAALFSSKTTVSLDLAGYPTHFSPEPGWDMGLRRIEEHLIYFFAEGRCSAVLNGKRLVSVAGSLCWICPGTSFRFFRGSRDVAPVIYRFRFEVKKAGRKLQPKRAAFFVPEAWGSLETIKQLALEAHTPGPLGPWKARTLLSLLSIHTLGAAAVKTRGPILSDQQKGEIAAWISGRIDQRTTPAQLAKHLDYSPGHFARIFRRSYGLSPRSWLVRERLRYAGMLLRESHHRISEIADRLGYPDPYFFSRQFHQVFGMSPRQWRRSGS